MDYLTFIDNTREMNPQQRSEYFNKLTFEQREHLIDQAGEVESIMIHSRMVIGAEQIEREPNEFKKAKMYKLYDKLCDEYVKINGYERVNT